MGIVLYYLGRSDEALQHFDQALSLDPTLENVRDHPRGYAEGDASYPRLKDWDRPCPR